MTLQSEEPAVCVYGLILELPKDPGLLWYHFIAIYGEKTVWYGAPIDGLGGAGTESGSVPTDWQITVYDPKAGVPEWYRQSMVYQIFVDRFYRGDHPESIPELHKGNVYHPHWEDRPFYTKDPKTGNLVAYDFFGGTLQGVIDKLPYIKSLGATAIYLNPIFESVSNHKYDTGDYKKIDPGFGGDKAFDALVEQAGKHGIHIILDGVFSHTGDDSVYFQDAVRSQESPYFSWFKFIEYPKTYDCWWGVTTLPNVNELDPAYRRFINTDKDSVIKHWVRKGIGGWRLDVVDELPGEFVQEMFRELKGENPEAVLIGEVWEDASRKESYGKLREYLWGRELDAVINYPFRSAVIGFLTGVISAWESARRLNALKENYPPVYLLSALNVIGSHDVPRALSLLGDAPPESELTAQEQAKYNLTPVQRKKGLSKLKLAAFIQFTSPGVPCVYYGDEAGVEGYSDPQNRRTYPWGSEETELIKWYRLLAGIRKKEPLLVNGFWSFVDAGEDVLCFVRQSIDGRDCLGGIIADGTLIAVINRKSDAVSCLIDVGRYCMGPFEDCINETDNKMFIPDDAGKIKVEITGYGFLLLKNSRHRMFAKRSAGILLHPTSLPGPYGIGDVGREAKSFVDWLHKGRQTWWQTLPVNSIDFTGSPYQSDSAFAGNCLLISPETLKDAGYIQRLIPPAGVSDDRVEFMKVREWKDALLREAYANFRQKPISADYEEFLSVSRYWLDDYCLFQAMKKIHAGKAWTDWNTGTTREKAEKIIARQAAGKAEAAFIKFVQYIFYSQWSGLKNYANSKGIRILGDLPIFVAHDSADVWAHPELFDLDAKGMPRTQAGVPPDYFSKTGQLWGNPHYLWDRHAETDFSWWTERVRWLMHLADAVRIDHFRGFEAYWVVPAKHKTARNGKWIKGPGRDFFLALYRQLGKLPLVAENLGVITPEVDRLCEAFCFPGMNVAQFSYYKDGDIIREPDPQPNTICYTGTHDNDTTLGWLKMLAEEDPALLSEILCRLGVSDFACFESAVRLLIKKVMQSAAHTAIIPMQDWLGLDSASRMNRPGTASGNWDWRMAREAMTKKLALEMADMAEECMRQSN